MKRKICLLVSVLLFIQCKDTHLSEKNDASSLYLPDLSLLSVDYETVDSTKAYAKFADKLYELNRDLKSSQMYVEAAWHYDRAGKDDLVAQMLHLAIDRGLSNPKILQKLQYGDKYPDTPVWQSLVSRLDSIQVEIKNVSHFSVEMQAMNQFWDYFDRARKDTSRAKEIFKEYIFEGPMEIRDFYVARYESPSNMYGQMINGAPEYYEYLKDHLHPDSLTALNKRTIGWMRNFKSIYPQAIFPKVFIVPGILNSGGTTTEMGMFVGGEMFGRSENMPIEGLTDWQKGALMKFSDLPVLTMHELVHCQQIYKDNKNRETVLLQIVAEGVCDFLVELSSGQKLENDNLKYLEDASNMSFILEELRKDLLTDDNSKWLYNGGSIEDRPHDLGYTMGYLITKSYYNRQKDKKKAIYELLNTGDVLSILKESDYAFLMEDKPIPADISL